MSVDVLNLRCIRCGAEGLVRDNGSVTPCRWVIAWSAPLPRVRPGDASRAACVDESWEGPEWPWRCPRCDPSAGRRRRAPVEAVS
jgi:hypothetical protein